MYICTRITYLVAPIASQENDLIKINLHAIQIRWGTFITKFYCAYLSLSVFLWKENLSKFN